MLDCAIIGAGPAGITAAIQLKRAEFNVLLFEKEKIGGLVHNANFIENYLGFPNGITGKKLCTLFVKHLKNYNIEIKNECVQKIEQNDNLFAVLTKTNQYLTRTVLFATGTIPNLLDTSLYAPAMKNEIYYEVNNLLPNIKENQRCCILGGGDAAFDYALHLSKKKVHNTIVFRSNKPSCILPLIKKGRKNKYISLLSNAQILKIDKNKNELIDIDYVINGEKSNLQTDFILVAYGRKKNDFLFSTIHEKNNIPGFYFAGDVQTENYRQIGIAVGQGLHTAMKIETYLRSNSE